MHCISLKAHGYMCGTAALQKLKCQYTKEKSCKEVEIQADSAQTRMMQLQLPLVCIGKSSLDVGTVCQKGTCVVRGTVNARVALPAAGRGAH